MRTSCIVRLSFESDDRGREIHRGRVRDEWEFLREQQR